MEVLLYLPTYNWVCVLIIFNTVKPNIMNMFVRKVCFILTRSSYYVIGYDTMEVETELFFFLILKIKIFQSHLFQYYYGKHVKILRPRLMLKNLMIRNSNSCSKYSITNYAFGHEFLNILFVLKKVFICNCEFFSNFFLTT